MKFIINRKTFISMLFIGLTLLGYVSYKNLAVELLPNSELPILIVMINSQMEVDPKYMENQGVIPVEGVISTMDGVEEIASSATQQRGTITVSFSQSTDVKIAYLKLLEKVESIRGSLPEEFMVNVVRVDIEQLTNQFMNLQVRGSGGVDRVRNLADKDIVPDLENIDGIAGVTVYGGREKSIEIILDEKACEAYGITAFGVRNLLNQNGRERAFVGQIVQNEKRYFVNVTAVYDNIKDIENLIVQTEGPVLLKDIAEVFFGVKEETSYSRINGLDAVTIQLARDFQVNMIDLSHRAKDVIDKLNDELKFQDVEIVIQSNEAKTMEDNINQIIRLALFGGLFAVIILWIFLRNIRLVFSIALAIPISIFTAMNLFYAFGITINSLTLVGMALAIGMLLDNSIVVLENIYRLASQKNNPDESVLIGTKEVLKAIIAATFTTIAIFLPFLFTTNFFIELLGKHIGISIMSTLFVSLAVALLLIPMMTHYFMKRKPDRKSQIYQKVSLNNRLLQIYLLLLKSCMRFPARTIIGAVVVFFIAIFISLAISINVLEEVETTEFRVYVTMPGGSTLENTDLVVTDIESRLENIPEKQDIISTIEEEEAIVTLVLQEDYEDIDNRTLPNIKSDIQDRIDDISSAEVSMDQPQSGGGGGFGGGGMGSSMGFERMLGIGVQRERVVIKGQDFDKMKNVAEDVQYYLEEISSVQSASLSIQDNRPEVHIAFDTELMSQYNVSLNSVVSELNSFQTEFSSGASFKQGTEDYDIIIKTNLSDIEPDRNMDDLKELPVPDNTGSNHELQNMSDIFYSTGMAGINRVNQEKQVEVSYRLLDEVNDSKALLEAARFEIDEVIASMIIPSGIAVEVIHEESEFEDFYFLFFASLILIYMILASVFESMITPFVILFSVPLAAVGSLIALILTGNSLFNANTLTGFIILVGVVVNNGIILLDYSKILSKRGYTPNRALIMAGLARVRPILITAITTIVAMIPLAMGNAEYVASIGAPFAITVIGGLSLSTLFTLLFIPTLNSGLESSIRWISNLNWKIKILQLVLFVAGLLLVYFRVQEFIWKLVYIFLLIILIPGLTYFILSSLRQASTELIKPDEPITIQIQNLVKIYDRDSRFVREWKGGLKIRERLGLTNSNSKHIDFGQLLWQIPFLGFLIYFSYFYLRNNFWYFLIPIIIYLFFLFTWKPIGEFLKGRVAKRKKGLLKKLPGTLNFLLFWGIPFFNLILYQIRFDNIALVIFIGLFWYLALSIYTASNHLHKEKININRLKGRFSNLRRNFYSFVLQIPIIGKKKTPFKALSSVSLEIGKGMFGLLGPNGAGKTTMMRIICGILEQSYGKVWINGIDTNKKREELQGLIGYLPQAFGSYENMTAWEFLNYQAIMKNLLNKAYREKMVNQVLSSVHMDEHKNEKIGSFSGGMKQRIGIAQILLHLPRILVVDEPTAGLDPRERIRFRNLLVELSRDRVVIFSTHIIEDIASSCNKVAVLNKGALRYLGEPLKMAKTAEGLVWTFDVPAAKFDTVQKDLLIVHHMRDGDKIRIRCISDTQPDKNATQVKPSLEDSYLCLLKDITLNKNQ